MNNTVVMPYNSTMVSGNNHILTFSGTQNTEGALSLSSDGRFLVLGGYNQSAYVTGVSSNGSAATVVNRVVGLVDMNGNVDTTTALQDVSSTKAFRSAFSTNGTDIWVNGLNGSGTTSGIHYTTIGSTTSTQIQSVSAGGAVRSRDLTDSFLSPTPERRLAIAASMRSTPIMPASPPPVRR